MLSNKARFKMNADASIIDRKMETLIGKALDSEIENRAAIIAEINELSASRTRMMRPKFRPNRQSVDTRREALLNILKSRKEKEKRIPA